MTSATTLIETLQRDGYVVVPDLLSPAELTEVRRDLGPELDADRKGRNDFEGVRTQRVYSLVARGQVFERLVEHPLVLAICDALLLPNYLLTASQAIQIHPGETPQPLHYDDGFYSLPRPRPSVSISTIVAIDAFTAGNGATQILPGSHRWNDAEIADVTLRPDYFKARGRVAEPGEPVITPTLESQLVDVLMPAGAAIVFLGTLVHRGGRNRSSGPRLALSNQYCQPWARQQENYTLSIDRKRARNMSPRVQAMLGYSVHPPFMGHIAGVHPRRLLDVD